MGAIDDKLKSLGITLPQPAAPAANYVPYVIAGPLLVVSGQLAFNMMGKVAPQHRGKVGHSITEQLAREAARLCALNIIAQAKEALGDLDRVARVVRLGGFMNTVAGYSQIAPIMNGASDLMVEVFGDKGRHARTTVGVAEVPFDCCVEVEAMIAIAP